MGVLSEKLSIKDIQIKDKSVFVRVDFNVPIHDGVITSTQRIEATIPTIKYILDKEPKVVILASHLGRTNGKFVKGLSLKPVAEALEKMIQHPVTFLEGYTEQAARNKVKNAKLGEIFLLENLRFHPEEEGHYKDDNGNKVKVSKEAIDTFCKNLSSLCDVYVNDAFGTAHRAHSSIVGINAPVKVCGFLMLKELQNFSLVLESPKKPMMAILGGAKVSDKILLIKNFISKVDICAIVGGMSYTFLKEYKGKGIGDSLYDEPGSKEVHNIMKIAESSNVQIILPIDYVIADKFDNDSNKKVCKAEDGIPDGWMGLDIGEKTIELLKEAMSKCATIVWNGPAGVFEMPSFCKGTNSLLEHMSYLTSKGINTIIGGGDTASAAINLQKIKKLDFTHVSTGGGASLELLEGKELPGITTLSSK